MWDGGECDSGEIRVTEDTIKYHAGAFVVTLGDYRCDGGGILCEQRILFGVSGIKLPGVVIAMQKSKRGRSFGYSSG